MRVVSVGECTIDRYLEQKQDFVGGISLNFAVNAKRAGADAVSFVSCTGTDAGDRIVRKLDAEGIDHSHLATRHGATAHQDIMLKGKAERVFPTGGYDPGVLNGFELSAADLAFVQEHDIIASALFVQMERVFKQVMNVPFEGWRVADFLDLSDYEKNIGIVESNVDRLTIAFISGDAAMMESLRPLSRESRCMILVTMGADGSVALVKGEPLFQTAVSATQSVDSTGCGDAFQAAFTVDYRRTGDVQHALEAGARQAARVLQHFGATG